MREMDTMIDSGRTVLKTVRHSHAAEHGKAPELRHNLEFKQADKWMKVRGIKRSKTTEEERAGQKKAFEPGREQRLQKKYGDPKGT